MNQLTRIRAKGFTICESERGNLLVSPDSLSSVQREFILANKPAILQQLRIEKALLWLAGIGEENPLVIAEFTSPEKLSGLLDYITKVSK